MISRLFGPRARLDLKFFENTEEFLFMCIIPSCAVVYNLSANFPPFTLKNAKFVVSIIS